MPLYSEDLETDVYKRIVGSAPNGRLSIDSFGRLRVSNPVALLDSQMEYGLDPLQLEAITSQSAGDAPTIEHSPTTRMAALTITATAAADKLAALQSYRFTAYQPGKSQQIFMTGVIGAATSGARKRVGYFNATHSGGVATVGNGVFFQQGTDGVLSWNIANAGAVADTVNQDSWNVDRLDGTGSKYNPSGYELDITKAQIFAIDLQFLAMGRVRVGFDIGGEVIVCHEFCNANTTKTAPYMQTATLPVRWEIYGNNASGTMYAKCAAVASEGGREFQSAYHFSAGSQVTCAANARRYILCALRPTATFNSIANRINIMINSMDLNCVNAKASPSQGVATFELIYGATPDTALTYANANATYSGMDVFLGDGARYVSSLTGAIVAETTKVVFGGGGSGASRGGSQLLQSSQRYPLTLTANGAVRSLGTVYLVGQTSIDTTDVLLAGSISWMEV